jgi:hypothetical protein
MGSLTDGGTKADVHLLVDFENLKPSADDVALIRSEEYRLWVFHGPHQNKFDAALVKAWQPLGERVDFVQTSKHGKNALDFHIAFKLGQLFLRESTKGQRASYVVVSGDGGFEPLFDHMRALGCTVALVGSIPEALKMRAQPSSVAWATPAPQVSQAPERPSRGIIPAVSRLAAASAPKKKAATKATGPLRNSIVDSDATSVIAGLRAHPKNRPGDRAALERYTVARLGNKVTTAVAAAVIRELEQQKVVSFNGVKAAYNIPKAKK